MSRFTRLCWRACSPRSWWSRRLPRRLPPRASPPPHLTGVVKDSQGAVVPGRDDRRRPRAFGHDIRSGQPGDGRFTMPGMRVGGPYKVTAALSGFRHRRAQQHHADPRRHAGPRLHAEAGGGRRDRDGRRHHRPGVQLDPHRRRHRGDARRSRHAADDFRTHHRHHPADAAVRRRSARSPARTTARTTSPSTARTSTARSAWRHDRRPRRPHGRCADLARSDRAGPGERGAVRRPSGQLHRRQRQLGDAQRHQPVHRLGLLPLPQPVVRRHGSGRPGPTTPRHLQHDDHRRVGRRADRQEQAVLLRRASRSRTTRGRSRTFTSNPGGAPVAGNTTRVLDSDLSGAQRLPEAELQLRHRPLRQRHQRSRPASRG